MEGKTFANYIIKIIKEKKGEEIKIVDVKKLALITDYFVICTGTVSEHCNAISNSIEEKLKENGIKPFSVDRATDLSWIAMDYGDVIVHIMTEEKRKLYDIEKIWKESKLKVESKRKAKS